MFVKRDLRPSIRNRTLASRTATKSFPTFVDFRHSAYDWRRRTGFRKNSTIIGCRCRGTAPISNFVEAGGPSCRDAQWKYRARSERSNRCLLIKQFFDIRSRIRSSNLIYRLAHGRIGASSSEEAEPVRPEKGH